MSYFDCVEDVAEEAANAILQSLGIVLNEDDETVHLPSIEVAQAMREMTPRYGAALDAHVVHIMVEQLQFLSLNEEDEAARNGGIKRAKGETAARINTLEFAPEASFRWFMVNAESLNLGIADSDSIDRAYRAYWIAEFNRIMELVIKLAIDRDNNDDQFYAYQAEMEGFDENDA